MPPTPHRQPTMRRQTSSAVAREHRSFDSPSYNWLSHASVATMAVALSDDTSSVARLLPPVRCGQAKTPARHIAVASDIVGREVGSGVSRRVLMFRVWN